MNTTRTRDLRRGLVTAAPGAAGVVAGLVIAIIGTLNLHIFLGVEDGYMATPTQVLGRSVSILVVDVVLGCVEANAGSNGHVSHANTYSTSTTSTSGRDSDDSRCHDRQRSNPHRLPPIGKNAATAGTAAHRSSCERIGPGRSAPDGTSTPPLPRRSASTTASNDPPTSPGTAPTIAALSAAVTTPPSAAITAAVLRHPRLSPATRPTTAPGISNSTELTATASTMGQKGALPLGSNNDQVSVQVAACNPIRVMNATGTINKATRTATPTSRHQFLPSGADIRPSPIPASTRITAPA